MPYRPSAGRNQRLAGGPKEPDLVPIMNLFITIIPFMLYMLVIAQIALVALNFAPTGGGGGGGQGPGGGKPQEKKIEVYLMNQDAPERGLFRGFEVREPGMETVKIPFTNGYYDFVRLDQVLKDIRSRNANQSEINVSPYPDVLYGPLIQTIDICKSNAFVNVMYKPTGVGYF